jgi:hypothetical protein
MKNQQFLDRAAKLFYIRSEENRKETAVLFDFAEAVPASHRPSIAALARGPKTIAAKPFVDLPARRLEMAPQSIEKIESAPGNGRRSVRPDAQDIGLRGRRRRATPLLPHDLGRKEMHFLAETTQPAGNPSH